MSDAPPEELARHLEHWLVRELVRDSFPGMPETPEAETEFDTLDTIITSAVGELAGELTLEQRVTLLEHKIARLRMTTILMLATLTTGTVRLQNAAALTGKALRRVATSDADTPGGADSKNDRLIRLLDRLGP